jgi:hypothetical protein
MTTIAERRALIIEHLKGFIGKPCPTNTQISEALGIARGTVTVDMLSMQRAVVFTVEISAQRRKICIGGEWTEWSRPSAAETPLALKILELLKSSVGKPCPTDARLAKIAGVKRSYVFHAMSSLTAAGVIEIENRLSSTRRVKTEAGWTDWTARTKAVANIPDYVPPPFIETPQPSATCFLCGSSSLHPCRHLQAMGYRIAA